MRAILFLLLLFLSQSLMAQPNPPILRQPLTTNSHSGQAPNDWNIAIWNPAIKRWLTPTNVLMRIAAPNDGTSTNFFFDTQIHRPNATSKLFAIYNGGSNAVTIGPNGGLTMGRGFNSPFPGGVLLAVFDTTLGETNLNEIFVQSKRSGSDYFGATDFLTDTNDASFILTAFKGPTADDASRFAFQVGEGLNPDSFTSFTMQFLSFTHDYFHIDPDFTLLTRTNYLFSSSVRVTNTHILMSLQNSNTPVLEVDGIGDLRMIKRVPYIWPAVQGSAGTSITNDGFGNLGWNLVPSGGSGAFIRSDSTGRGTNTTFVSALTNLDDWVSSTNLGSTAIGVNVWPLGGNAKRNTFIGQDIAYTFAVNSGDDLTNSDNIACGIGNLTTLNGGYRNVAIGSTALQSVIDGNGHVGIGYRALTSIKGGAGCIGIGDGALFSITNGFGNVGVGIETHLNGTNTDYVSAFGHHAGYGSFPGVSAGSFSTWIGGQSGGSLRTNIVHVNTTALGYLAGYQGGSNCTYLGAYAGRQNSNDANVLIVDGLDRGSYANELAGSIIYGNLNSTVASQRLLVNGGVLSVPTGKLGVGTTNVSTGTINAVSSANGTPIYFSDGVVKASFLCGTFGANIPGAWIQTVNNFPFFFGVNSGNPSISISTSGKLGVGNTNAAAPLDVWGPTTIGVFGPTAWTAQLQSTDAAGVGVGAALGLGGNYNVANAKWNFAYVQGIQDTADGFGGALLLWTSSSGDDGEVNSAIYERMRITKRGRVGIGTNAPEAKVHIVGTGAINGLLRVGTTATDSRFTVATNVSMIAAGNSTSNAVISGAMYAATTAFTNLNATGTMTNLANVSIPAHFMTNNLDALHAIWRGNMPLALANTNQFQIVFGSSTILDTGLQTASNTVFSAECWIVRTGNTSQHVEGRFEWGPGNGAPFAFTNANLEIAETNGIATTLALKGGALRPGAHTNNFFRVWYEPATR